MRVLVIHNRYRLPGGEDVAASADISLLRDAGHDVVVHEVVNPSGQVATARALAMAPWNEQERRRLRRVIEEVRPDIAHAHNTWFALGPAPLREMHRADIPLVVTTHNYRLLCVAGTLFRDGHACCDCVGTNPWRGVLHRCYKDSAVASLASALTISTHRIARTWDHVSTFLAPSTFVRDRLVEGGLPAERIRVRSNHTADPGPRSRPPSASNRILFVGRLSKEKGVDLLLDAWSRLPPSALELLLVGDGPERPALEARGVPNVGFTGRVGADSVTELMGSARCLVVPSQCHEAQGLVVLEAMAAGLPAVVSGGGGLPEAVDHDANFVVPLDAGAAGWSAALARLTNSIIDEAGERARSRYLAHHTGTTALDSLLQTYEQALVPGWHRRL
jgi:glycosyltransferase involved in cell wall biosynthesis